MTASHTRRSVSLTFKSFKALSGDSMSAMVNSRPPRRIGRGMRLWGAGVTLAILSLAFLEWGIEERRTSNPVSSATTGDLTDLWLSSDSLLVGLKQVGWITTIGSWKVADPHGFQSHAYDLSAFSKGGVDPKRQPLRKAIQSNPTTTPRKPAELYRQDSVPSKAVAAAQQKPLAESSGGHGVSSGPIVAVSRTGEYLAWIAQGNVSLVQTSSARKAGTTSKAVATLLRSRPGQAVDLAFASTDVLSILYDDGTVELRQAQGGAPTTVRTPLTSRSGARLWRSGQWIAVVPTVDAGSGTDSASDLRSAIVVNTHSLNQDVRRFQLPRSTLGKVATTKYAPAAVSEAGHLALGLETGDVLHLHPEGEEPAAIDSVTLAAPGSVLALTFLDDQRVIAAGDFRGIHLLSPGRQDEEIAPAPIGTTLLAISPGLVAFTAGDSLQVRRLIVLRYPSDVGFSLIGAAIFIGVVATTAFRGPRPVALQPLAGLTHIKVRPPQAPGPPPNELITAISRGECMLFAGSGLSAQAGLPTWPEFLGGLAESTGVLTNLDENAKNAIGTAIAAGNYAAAAEEVAAAVPPKDFRDYVTTIGTKARPGPIHKVIEGIPFAAALTTNFDTLLDSTFLSRSSRSYTAVEAEGSGADALLRDLRAKQFFVLSLFGRYDRLNSLLFTGRHYRETLTKNVGLKQLLRSMAERYSFFFVGTSLAGIREFMESLELGSLPLSVKHFALVSCETELAEVEARSLELSFQIKAMSFVPTTGYPEVREFLDVIRKATRAAERPTEDLPRLRKLVLQNIGPFEHQELAFGDSWNVILGDNGVGKTIVLRAIAAALAGQEAPPEATSRLLRTGAAKGKIEVHVGASQTSSVVELSRDLDGRVKVVSASLSPLRLGNWLVLAFPALRAMTYGATPDRGPPQRPSAADVAPLLINAPDTRLSDLKAWLIELKVRATLNDPDGSAARIFKRFFEVLATLTPDVGLEFEKIDEKKILVRTSTGVVPLELVSQGTASVLCWVGVLIQRLYEVHGALPDPESGPALVAVDEIDAHMHPAWQRSLVPQLKKLFPQIQFLVTTHSPMIVGNLDKEKGEIVFKVRREGSRVVFDQPDVKTKGLRADQILTSPLFAFETSRDVETEAMLKEYTTLVSRDPAKLTQEEHTRMQKAAEYLEVVAPTPQERSEAAKAYQLIRGALEQELSNLNETEKEKLVTEVKAQINEAVTGSRRPS